MTELIGWASTFILACTLTRQVYTQYRSRSTAGVSKWLFVGQLAASVGFVIYSALVRNWIFVFTNSYILLIAIAGETIYLRNKQLAAKNADYSQE